METLKTQIYLEKPPDTKEDIEWERRFKRWARMRSRHVCGLQGFGYSVNDVCPACEKAKEEKYGRVRS